MATGGVEGDGAGEGGWVGGDGDAAVYHSKGDWEIEGVVGGLVHYDEAVLDEGELGEINRVFWGSNQIYELTKLCHVGHLTFVTVSATCQG